MKKSDVELCWFFFDELGRSRTEDWRPEIGNVRQGTEDLKLETGDWRLTTGDQRWRKRSSEACRNAQLSLMRK